MTLASGIGARGGPLEGPEGARGLERSLVPHEHPQDVGEVQPVRPRPVADRFHHERRQLAVALDGPGPDPGAAGARIPRWSASVTSRSNGSSGSFTRCARTRSKSAPASTSAPSAMSPEIPAIQSKYAILMPQSPAEGV